MKYSTANTALPFAPGLPGWIIAHASGYGAIPNMQTMLAQGYEIVSESVGGLQGFYWMRRKSADAPPSAPQSRPSLCDCIAHTDGTLPSTPSKQKEK